MPRTAMIHHRSPRPAARPRPAALLGAALILGFAGALPARAHPHVWITTRAEIHYAPDGRVTAVRHAWTFDPAYSAFSVQGLGEGAPAPEALAALARDNTENLADQGYFTRLKLDGRKQEFGPPGSPAMTYADGRLTLHFTLPLKEPGRGAVTLEVFDPTVFVDFTLAEGQAATLVGAPAACKPEVQRSKAAPAQAMSESFFAALTAASSYGAQFANRIVVSCS
ncbi:DUF1007 family protein [Methylobacterium sp.]|uniref:DUF1007 family protein n=1 Tax=Methylobacterium sp. TaxID=409 RepID=UPI0025905EC9|nr:DUF1007 family protein [Methylobacterium sp.]